jgi:hypothetical protein
MPRDADGHVFVTHGDVTRLACDAWLVPTDAARTLEHPWRSALPAALPPPEAGWAAGRVRAQLAVPRDQRDPAAWLVNVGASQSLPLEWYLDGVRAFVARATADLAAQPPLHGRARHLLALPLVGTGLGGITHIKGDMVAALVGTLEDLARRQGVDLVLVLWTPAAFAAGQSVRRAALEHLPDAEIAEASGLQPVHVAEARRLAALAERGRLVLFLGAGVSAAAGLPVLHSLLHRIAAETNLTERDIEALDRLDPLDRARVLEGRLQRQGVALGTRVAEIFAASRPSLSHTLLASFPVNEMATTNYDQLFEQACEGAQQPVAVLPYERASGHRRWLLKMHGCISRPHDIVLTRDDYLRYGERRAALAGIVQALLVTRHILFVGFSLNDDNFHRLVHDVRQAVGGDGSRRMRASPSADPPEFGTALLLVRQAFLSELWAHDVRTLPMIEEGEGDAAHAEAARRLEIFLDLVAMFSTSSAAHLLDPTFNGVLTEEERQVRDALARLPKEVPDAVRRSSAWARVQRFLTELGADES